VPSGAQDDGKPARKRRAQSRFAGDSVVAGREYDEIMQEAAAPAPVRGRRARPGLVLPGPHGPGGGCRLCASRMQPVLVLPGLRAGMPVGA